MKLKRNDKRDRGPDREKLTVANKAFCSEESRHWCWRSGDVRTLDGPDKVDQNPEEIEEA